MRKIRKILRPALAALTAMVLLAVPYAHTAQYPVNLSGKTVCHCCCSCCQESADRDETVDIGSKCGCDISRSEPITDLPPATVAPTNENNSTVISFNGGEESFETVNTVDKYFVDGVLFDDTGPPLYLAHSSFII